MEEKEFNYINAIPLVDVMLVLLTITLTTATFITQGSIKVHLPSASVKPQKESKIVTISMSERKKIYVNKTEVTKDTLLSELSKYDKEKDTIEIRADKTLTIDEVTQVLGIVQAGGFKKMAIKTEIALR